MCIKISVSLECVNIVTKCAMCGQKRMPILPFWLQMGDKKFWEICCHF